MTEQEAIKLLQLAQQNGDIEAAHSDADDVLCQFLNELGYTELVKEWDKVEKWYA